MIILHFQVKNVRSIRIESHYNVSMPAKTFDETYISVDIETAGPNPSQYSLLSIGACSVMDPGNNFYIELQPVNDEMLPETYAVHRLSLDDLKSNGVPPLEAMARFDSWLNGVTPPGRKPVFVAFNAPFDWMFISDYFNRYLKFNPFGHAALDIKAFYMGLHRSSWKDTAMNKVSEIYLDGKQISHNALEDARDQAQIFSRLYTEARNRS
jgi:DNA polymerase III epsilon subunit-like protein